MFKSFVLFTFILSTWFWMSAGCSFGEAFGAYLVLFPLVCIGFFANRGDDCCSFTEEEIDELLKEDDSNRKSSH